MKKEEKQRKEMSEFLIKLIVDFATGCHKVSQVVEYVKMYVKMVVNVNVEKAETSAWVDAHSEGDQEMPGSQESEVLLGNTGRAAASDPDPVQVSRDGDGDSGGGVEESWEC